MTEHLVVICHPDEAPHLEIMERYDLPDGCDGLLTISPGGDDNLPAKVCMPANLARPKNENISDYVIALSYALTYLKYNKMPGVERVRPSLRETIMKALEVHTNLVLNCVCERESAEGNFSQEALVSLIEMGFVKAHDIICESPECKQKIHDKVFGAKGSN